MIYLHGSPGADRTIAHALPVEFDETTYDRKDDPDDAAR
jgi:hypothetical protein